MATVDHITDANNFESFADNCPYSELADGRHDGMHTALWEIRDRAEFLRILAGLERNRGAFLTELQSAQFVADGGDADLPLEAFADLMFGPGAGGVRGHYADGFVSSFAIIAPFVASLH